MSCNKRNNCNNTHGATIKKTVKCIYDRIGAQAGGARGIEGPCSAQRLALRG